MRVVWVLLASIGLSACASANVRTVGPGTLELSSAYDWSTPRYGVADYLAKRANEACPRGFEKLNERDVSDHGNMSLVWTVRCL